MSITRHDIKGRPFWSKVLSVRLNPTTERSTLYAEHGKYIGMDVHRERNLHRRHEFGRQARYGMCPSRRKPALFSSFIDGQRGNLQVTFEEGTWAAWLYDLLKPRVTNILVCDPQPECPY